MNETCCKRIDGTVSLTKINGTNVLFCKAVLRSPWPCNKQDNLKLILRQKENSTEGGEKRSFVTNRVEKVKKGPPY